YKDVDIVNDINQYYETKYADDFIGVAKDHKDFNAYSESVFEASPLNRVVEQGAPGKDWKANKDSDTDHTIKFNWDTNIANEVVTFKVNFANPGDTETPALVQDGFYPANQLYVTITKDENWTATDGNNHTTKEYKDKQGRVILKRTFASTGSATSEAHDTYYVYDRFGNLTYVIPPKVTTNDSVSESELSELCYQYKYDNRNRLIEKKIPGKDWEYIVYNKLDQPILTQDASLRKEMTGKAWDQWLFTKYDGFGRVLYTGTVINGSNRKVIQNRVNDATTPQYESKLASPITIGGTTVYYSKDAYPTSIYKVFTINYYDGYGFDIVGLTNPGTVYGETVLNHTKSLLTGSKVRVLDTNDWITTVTRYDNKARPIYVASKNEYLNTTDIVESDLDFTGKVKQTKTIHTKDSNAAIVTIDTFTYDDMGRLLIQTQKINDQGVETIVENRYDKLGQLERKKTGGGLQDVNYTYNVRGWLKSINNDSYNDNDLFDFTLNYNTPQHGAKSQYKYNIAEAEWKTASDNVGRWYAYDYDAFERILSATSNDGNYSVSNITYDKMGNIMTLNRSGWQNTSSYPNLDVLGYTYDSGNKLLSVTDSGNKSYGFKDRSFTGNDYSYDANGNLIEDKNKGITSVSYNHFNFPTQINVTNPDHDGNLQYVYDANGVKLKKIALDRGTTNILEYNGNFVYENGSLKSIAHPEGYVEQEDDGSFAYVYEHRDIWKNTRITYADNNKDGVITAAEIRREQNYYPFGMTWQGVNSTIRNATNNLKTYQGQELTEDLGLNTHEWRYRMSDRSIGRFWQIDPLSEDYMYNATYAFQENKMGIGIELEGLEVDTFPVPELDEAKVYSEISHEVKAIAAYIARGFDKLFFSGSGKATQNAYKSGDKSGTMLTTVNTKLTAEVGFNLEKYINDIQESPDGTAIMSNTPMVIAKFKKEVYFETSLKGSFKATPVADVTLEGKEKIDIFTGKTTIKARGTFGIKENGIFVSGSTSSDNSSKMEAGLRLKVKTPKLLNGTSFTGDLIFGVRVPTSGKK
ncbi:RHS repeat domain-containing protein, partial [Aquimarina spinulae]